jgi:Flp pilus assembly protein TadD
MKRGQQPSGAGGLVLAMGLLALAGCRTVETTSRPEVDASFKEGRSKPRSVKPKQAADVQIAYGRTLERQGQDDAAIHAYQDAVKQDPRRADAYLRLAILHDKRGKFDESASYYQKALGASPGNPDVFCDKGYSLYLQRKLDAAEAALRQAIALRPEFPRAHNNLGLVLAHEGQRSAALAEFRKAGCSVADAHLNLAFVMAVEGRWEEAKKQYGLVLAANPKCEEARKGLKEVGQLARTMPVRADAGVVRASATAAGRAESAVGSGQRR